MLEQYNWYHQLGSYVQYNRGGIIFFDDIAFSREAYTVVGIALAALRSGFVFLGKVITKDQVVDAAANLLAKLINKAADMVHGSGITQQTFDQNIADHELKIALDHMNNFKFSSDPKKVVQEAAERYQAARKVFLLQASSQKGEAGIAFWQYTSELTLLLGLMNLYINDF